MNRLAITLALALCLSTTTFAAIPPYKDPAAPVETRVNDLVSRLTRDEKISLLGGTGFTTQPIARLDVPAFVMSDGPVGTRNDGKTTAYPAGIALGASFDVDNAKAIGTALGRDARARGVHILLGPAMDMDRSPLAGRNFEYFGEDPLLTGTLAAAYVEGLQSQRVAATIKHFAANEQEFDRNMISTTADERTLREIYLRPFQICLELSHPWCVMTSYNPINGIHASQNKWLITDVLKDEWHFPGFVMSDWDSCYDTLGMANAGLDLEMPKAKFYTPEKLKPLLDSGQVSESTIDDKVRRIFRVAFSMGWFDNPQKDSSIALDDPQNRAVALNAARDSLTLLKNDNHFLPLDRSKLHNVVLIGPCADPAVVSGGGSAKINAYHPVSILQGLADKLGNSVTITRVPWNPPGLSAATMHQQPLSGTWKASFFANQNLQGTPTITREEPFVDFRWPAAPLPPGIPLEHFSARFSATIHIQQAGDYLFACASDDGSRVYLDGKRIIDNWFDQALHEEDASVTLAANSDHAVTVEYYNGAHAGEVHFSWSAPRNLLPAEYADTIKKADVVLACLGFNDKTGAASAYEGEGFDRPYALPATQTQLLHETLALNPNTAVLLTAGNAVDTAGWLDHVPAFLMTWYPGSDGGTAIAETLLGENDPSGKLPFTWEHTLADYPAIPNYPSRQMGRINTYKEGVFIGYRRPHLRDKPPLFPFGFGLSYTSFQLGAPTTPQLTHDTVTLSVPVTNTGARPGREVVQLYATPPHADVPRPDTALVAYAKVSLDPGESKNVTVSFPTSALDYWDPATKTWTLTPGAYTLRAATSSLDPGQSTQITVSSP